MKKPLRLLVKGNRLGNPYDWSQSSSPWDSLVQWPPHLVQGPQVVEGLDNQLPAILLKYHAPNMLSQVQ